MVQILNMINIKRIILIFMLFSGVVSAKASADTLILDQQNDLFIKYLNLSKEEQFQLDERKLFSQKAIQLAGELNNPKALMEALSSNGYILAQEGHYAQAFEVFSKLKDMSDSVGYNNPDDWRRKAYLANVIGLIYKELGEYDKALSQYYTSLSICDSVDWKEGTSTALNNISLLYNLNGNTVQAISILIESKQIAELNGYDNLLFDIYINLMDMYIQIQEYDSALYSGKKALELSLRLNTPYNQAFVETGFGKLYSKEGKYMQGIKSLKQGIYISQKHGFDEIRLDATIELATLYRKIRNFHSADSALIMATSIDEKISIPLLHIKLLNEKAELNNEVGNYKSAYMLIKNAVNLKDSINSSWEKVKYAEIQALYNIKLQKERNMVLRKDLSIKQLQIKQQRFFIFIFIGFLIILTVLVIMFNQKRRFERKTNQLLRVQNEKITTQEKIIRLKNEEGFKQELDYKNRQLTAFSLSALKQSKSLDIIFQQINEMLHQQNIKQTTRTKLEQVVHQLRPLSSQKEWDEFRSYFEAVHPSFYINLKKAAPDLSFHEQKICAYLRLGMNTKEIASITFRQVRSVESTRFRIRKKFGLTANDNLFDFLEKL